jgi:hypothetical protein
MTVTSPSHRGAHVQLSHLSRAYRLPRDARFSASGAPLLGVHRLRITLVGIDNNAGVRNVILPGGIAVPLG